MSPRVPCPASTAETHCLSRSRALSSYDLVLGQGCQCAVRVSVPRPRLTPEDLCQHQLSFRRSAFVWAHGLSLVWMVSLFVACLNIGNRIRSRPWRALLSSSLSPRFLLPCFCRGNAVIFCDFPHPLLCLMFGLAFVWFYARYSISHLTVQFLTYPACLFLIN